MNLARLNLSYTVILATTDGVTGRKNIHEGELVQPGQTMVNLVDVTEKWVIANYKETQTTRMEEGQMVEIEVVGELDALRDDLLAGTDGLTTDVTDNSDLRSLELQEEVLRRSLKAANAGRMPTLAAFGSASYTGNDMEPFNFGGAAATDDSRYFWTHPISVGLQLSVPIFSGLTKMNRSRELKNQISQLSLQRSYARQQIDVQVRSALNDLLTARETMYAQADEGYRGRLVHPDNERASGSAGNPER